MANRRGFGRPLVRGPKRRTAWNGAFVDLANVDSSGTFQQVITEASLENIPNSTIVRCRGEIMVTVNNAASAALSRGSVTMGLMLVDSKALAIGITALQLPGTDIGSDWLWWATTGFGEDGRALD